MIKTLTRCNLLMLAFLIMGLYSCTRVLSIKPVHELRQVHPNWPEETLQLVSMRVIKTGMTLEHVIESWGYPGSVIGKGGEPPEGWEHSERYLRLSCQYYVDAGGAPILELRFDARYGLFGMLLIEKSRTLYGGYYPVANRLELEIGTSVTRMSEHWAPPMKKTVLDYLPDQRELFELKFHNLKIFVTFTNGELEEIVLRPRVK